jgi:uncharacterized protein YfaS (alpha-2-macroglobulin family)
MKKFGRTSLAGVALFSVILLFRLMAAETPGNTERRESLMKAYQAGNYKDAYEGLRKLALDPKNDSPKLSEDLTTGIQCLHNLGRTDEVDEFRESAVTIHKTNWRFLETAATSLVTDNQRFGYIVAGKFYRGNKNGGGRFVNTFQRDRVRALQLMEEARKLAAKETDKNALATFHLHLANMLLTGGGAYEPWRLQSLTDLSQLPDYVDGYYWPGNQTRGAPVDAAGNPVYHHVPKSYAEAKSDGERWRWNLMEAVELVHGKVNEVDLILANFLRGQFDVQTMQGQGYRVANQDGDKKEPKTGIFAIHTLGEDETIAQLANGIKRFKLPDEFNFIKIYERIAARGKSVEGEASLDALAQVYEDRRQYVKAAAAWKKAIAEYTAGRDNSRQKRLEQIIGNWGQFETVSDQPAGSAATVEYRFRNGTKVHFEAFPVKLDKLLSDVKNYLAAGPGVVAWDRVEVQNIGYRLVQQQQQQYVGEKAADWDLDLKPEDEHIDSRVTVKTPLTKPGAYLVTAKMENGNLTRIIMWVADTVIVKKMLDGKTLYYIADAVNGQPVANADVDFFGYRMVPVNPQQNQWKTDTTNFTAKSDKDGQMLVGNDKVPNTFNWLITATQAKTGLGGGDRLAYLGFTGVWYGQRYDQEYNVTHVFPITDRPVYRPAQKVHFKFWVRHAKYDQPDVSDFAGQGFTVQINNPKGEQVFLKNYTADAWGGLEGEWDLPKGATLGQYSLQIVNHGGGTFRVEEYKKPEFEVKVEAPKEPVMLGETITANIDARYYFGAPVAHAKVKYKVLRTSYNSNWYPVGRWDWFYGPGYWWFASEYKWFPGWTEWGMRRPIPEWWGGWGGRGGRNGEQPEVVLENEVAIGPDGKLKVVIDTLPAKELHGDTDHQYSITVEVVDDSRRTIVGTGNVLVARKPFQVFSWVDRGYYRVGDTVKASFNAHTLDRKPVEGKGDLTLYRLSYSDKGEVKETAVGNWKLDTNVEGVAHQQINAEKAGQYRLSYKVTDSKNHTIEGGYVFVIRGEGVKGQDFRFNDIELVSDRREYQPGEKVKLLINTARADSVVLLFLRPTNGVYTEPKMLRLKGKSIEEELAVIARDMPNFFVEALTVSNGKVYSETREMVVPPEKRILNVEAIPSEKEYLPGQSATIKLKVTDLNGKPFEGSLALTMYDRSVEYISGGSNVPEIKEFFWKWRRHHYPSTESSLGHYVSHVLRQGEVDMAFLGAFGYSVADQLGRNKLEKNLTKLTEESPEGAAMFGGAKKDGMGDNLRQIRGAPGNGGGGGYRVEADAKEAKGELQEAGKRVGVGGQVPEVEPTVRKNFADTAYWAGSILTDKEGLAQVDLKMPENLTGWKIKVWAMGHGTKVGQAETEVVTRKNIIVRLQAPRFFVEKDEVVLSANVHNYLKVDKQVRVVLDLEGKTLELFGSAEHTVSIPAGGEKRVDWRVKVTAEGQALVRMKAITDVESDAMQMSFPCYVHGMLKTESFSGVIRPDATQGQVSFKVPAERRINETRLEVRYSPTLAGAMVDALPYLSDYPYGCTEQTLNRFLPTVITQQVLMKMHLNLKEIQQKRTNLNAQELGDATERAKQWNRFNHNPVFDEGEVQKMITAGVDRLAGMQCSDGGWGWFSGYGEQSYPHTTAVVVHGLQVARLNGVVLPAGMLERGLSWLKSYQDRQLQMLDNAPTKTHPFKEAADNLDALVFMILTDAAHQDRNMDNMSDHLYRDRTKLAVYAKAMFGLALHARKQGEQLEMILKNIGQFLVEDEENQTAYLRLPQDSAWWNWYGSETESNGYYLKLLARTSPKDAKASRLVKYLLNNRKNATYWNSTRDTAVCIEAMAEYITASGEDKPDMTIEVWLDGKKYKEVKVDSKNLFSFDNAFVLTGDAVDTGAHKLEIKKTGTGPVYFNAYLSNFTLEDFITRAGLEVKVNRKYYKLIPVDKKIKVPGSDGQVLEQKVVKYDRKELENLATLKSGELVEVELEIDSKNDYEYVLFEDFKPAGFEPVEVRSGYNRNDLGAYVELRDERVCFFVRSLARGKHSVSYRMRAEIPGKFSALPAQASAMYAPELRGNSDEIKLKVTD